MKLKLKVDGEDAGNIRCKPITLLYDGSYGTQKIEIEDEFPPLNCRELVASYDQISDELIKSWIKQPIFVYCWYLMWGGNIADRKLALKLPESREEFVNAADNLKYVFTFLSAFLYRIIQAKGKPFRVQYPEIGLHPAIQANLGDLFIFCSTQASMMKVAKLGGEGKKLLETLFAEQWCNDNL
jgi:hypothetical protein